MDSREPQLRQMSDYSDITGQGTAQAWRQKPLFVQSGRKLLIAKKEVLFLLLHKYLQFAKLEYCFVVCVWKWIGSPV